MVRNNLPLLLGGCGWGLWWQMSKESKHITKSLWVVMMKLDPTGQLK